MILYNHNKVMKGKATIIDSSTDAMADKSIAISVLDTLSEKTKTENSNIQISLSLAIGEDLDDATFSKIAREYLEMTGFSDRQFVVYRHHDTAHQHIHICTSLMNENGEKVNMYNNYFASQKATREIEKKYNLKLVSSFKPSKENGVLKGLKDYKELVADIASEKASKAQVRKIVAKASTLVLQQYKPTTFAETRKLYKQLGVEIKEVKDEFDSHKGYVFGLLDRPDTPMIKASDLYLAFNEKILSRAFQKNIGKKEKSNPKRIDRTLSLLFKNYDSINSVDFERLLKEKNIVPLYDTYKDGRAYGLSYFDEKTGFIFKASDINKDYSFNAIKDRVNDTIATKPTISKLLEDNFYKLYNEMRSLGIRTSALNFAKEENTSSDLKIALFNEGIKDDNLEHLVKNYLVDKINKLEQSASFVEEKGLIFKALGEYYQTNLQEYLTNYDGVTETDYIENQFQHEGSDYVDFIKSTIDLKLITNAGIQDSVESFIENKVQEFALIPLKEHIKKSVQEQFTDILTDLNNVEKIKYITNNHEALANTVIDLVKEETSQTEELQKFDIQTIKEVLESNVNAYLNSQVVLAKTDIVQKAAAQLISGGLDQRIDQYNYFLLDKSNYAQQILSKLDFSETNLFKETELDAYLKRHIEKVESVILPFLELNKLINNKAEERDQFIAYTNLMEEGEPKLSKLYFKYNANEFSSYIDLFGKDQDKLKLYIVEKAEQLAIGKAITEEFSSLVDSLRQDFTLDVKHHITGNLTIDFYNYALTHKEGISDLLKQKLQNLKDFPFEKKEILIDQALSADGRMAKYFDKIYSDYLPMSTANVIIKNTLNTYINGWKAAGLSKKQIAGNLSNPNILDQIRTSIDGNLKSNDISNRIFDKDDLVVKLENRIGEIINNSYSFYAQEAPSNVLNEAQTIVNSLGQMFQNTPSKDGLNTARNDKRKRKTPD
ncbi:relaxase/mobilization nuclease domain-containing protein [Sphingobacterium sp. FBM7-1]|uniref:relaxase/mobilization nuclease domain-containing protein n=1 Tax=Sphingobacterium sp. FBM7-1 TaxID=2886688 RepID=UPI003980700B